MWDGEYAVSGTTYTQFCGGTKVDLIRSNAKTPNGREVLGMTENTGCQLSFASDSNDVDIFDLFLELGLIHGLFE